MSSAARSQAVAAAARSLASSSFAAASSARPKVKTVRLAEAEPEGRVRSVSGRISSRPAGSWLSAWAASSR